MSDMADYHRSMAKEFHLRAQQAKTDARDHKAARRFVDEFKARQRWAEYRGTREYHRLKAREFSA